MNVAMFMRVNKIETDTNQGLLIKSAWREARKQLAGEIIEEDSYDEVIELAEDELR